MSELTDKIENTFDRLIDQIPLKTARQNELNQMVEESINPEIKKIKEDGYSVGAISDGYHTFDELYEHRIELYIALCEQIISSYYYSGGKNRTEIWISLKHSDGTEIPGWFLLGINKEPGTQITYHLPEKYLGRLAGKPQIQILDIAPPYDGHTSADVLERLRKLRKL